MSLLNKTNQHIPFSNGYTASVVTFLDSGEYEVSVMVDGKIVYDTPVTSDVVRCKTSHEAWDVVGEIMNLAPIGGVRRHVGPIGNA